MSYNPQNPNGQATSANSSPVVLASDQSVVGTNQAQTAGATTSVNNGTTDAGTQRVTLSSDSTGQVIARGNAASGAADSGNPVKVGGRFNTSAPTLTDGQRGDLQLDASGNLKIAGTTTIGANSSVNVNQVAGTTVDTNSGVKSAGTQRVVLATDQPQLTNALKVDGSAVTQPVSGTLGITANSSVNVNQVAGTAVDTNSGNKSAGTQRMVIATDQPNLTTPLNTNVSQINGVAASMGNGVSGTGVQRVTLASDSTGQVALATGANTIGNVGINTGTNAIGSVNLSPTTVGGWSVSSQTNLTATATVSGGAGKFGGYMFYNSNSSAAYVQVFDTTGAVTLGTTPPTFVVPIPAAAGANLEFASGIAMASGIKIAATTTATGATTVTTGLTGFVIYK
jgi:hypothetical protein